MASMMSARGSVRDVSPPRTPQSRAPHSHHGYHGQQGTFFDDETTPVEPERDYDRTRDSHDLSLANMARTSIVDNMLLSLDQIPTGGNAYHAHQTSFTPFDPEDDPYAANTLYNASRYLRGHTDTASFSSDFGGRIDDSASAFSGHHTRGRRSGSGSNIPVGGLGGLRGMWSHQRLGSDAQSSSSRPVEVPFASSHARGSTKKGSKSSGGSSSFDFGYGQIFGTRRLGSRSASFDQGYIERSSLSPSKMLASSIMDRGRPIQAMFSDYDAAPTPTVPAGPRRYEESSSISVSATYPSAPSSATTYAPLHGLPTVAPTTASTAMSASAAAAPAPVVQRRNSIRSTSSKILRKNKPQQLQHQSTQESMRAQATEFYHATSLAADFPTPPVAYDDPLAPSPTVALRKQSFPSPIVPVQQPPPKERQGFFRRVFGGGSSSKQTSQAQRDTLVSNGSLRGFPIDSPASSRNNSQSNNTNSISSSHRPRTTQATTTTTTTTTTSTTGTTSGRNGSTHRPPQTAPHETAMNQTESTQRSLTKKPSSFFRRRKKSVSEAAPPPLPAPSLLMSKPQPRPADLLPAPFSNPSSGSLVKAMDPYLHGSDLDSSVDIFSDSREYQPAPTGERADSAEPVVKGFSPGYTPHKDATVRAVKPESRGTDMTYTPSRDQQQQQQQQQRLKQDAKPAAASFPSMPGSDASKLKLKVKRGGRASGGTKHLEETFLADSSSNDNFSPSGSTTTFGPPSDEHAGRRPKTSPTASPSGMHATPTPFHSRDTDSAIATSTTTTRPFPNVGDKRSEPSLRTAADRRPSAFPSAAAVAAAAAMANRDDEGWVLSTPSKQATTAAATATATATAAAAVGVASSSAKSNRLWLAPTSSEENLDAMVGRSQPSTSAATAAAGTNANSITPTETLSPTSPTDVFHSATSLLPIVQIDKSDAHNGKNGSNAAGSMGAPTGANDQSPIEPPPSDEEREMARKIFAGEEDPISKARAAAWLGEPAAERTRTRKAYMELYEWSGVSILAALRSLCNRLVLKAETQQLDRVLDSFSKRWCECNSNHGFKATDVVHTLGYSLLLLNTDLHLADIDQKMTRHQFVRNTLPSIRRVIADIVASEAMDETVRSQSVSKGTYSITELPSPSDNSPTIGPTLAPEPVEDQRTSLEMKRSRNRLSIRPPFRSDSDGPGSNSEYAAGDGCLVLVKAPYEGNTRGWETQMEIVLKEFYNSIKQQRLPLHGVEQVSPTDQQSSHNLSVNTMLRRTPSVLSKAPSDNISFRGRASDLRSVGSRWTSKNRSRPRVYPTSTVGSSRTSLDDQSVWSPAGSSTWSKYSLGKTQTSMSMESLGSHFAQRDYQQSIGFANALSQAIVREEGTLNDGVSEDFTRVAPLLEDETLELAGAPWAKEGILQHKHHLDSPDKKAKDRHWVECFAVIEKGWMRLFSFQSNSRSLRMRNKTRPSLGGVVGGGNWAENAEAVGSFMLRQTIATALPPPGYSKSRPNVWALSLPTGAVHLFQVGTPEIVKEFVSTANYWSARLSKEPLVGGVSNIEYGWGEGVINYALIRQDSTSGGPTPAAPAASGVPMPRQSLQNSIRSSIDHSGVIKARLPGDKVVIHDWTSPTQSMLPSNLMEVDQLKALTAYVKNIEDELARHNELRAPMLIAFSPRHPNAGRAMANWEKKSAYLLREIVKFKTYVDSLNAAQSLKEKIYAEREANNATKEATADDGASIARGRDGNAPSNMPPKAAFYHDDTRIAAVGA